MTPKLWVCIEPVHNIYISPWQHGRIKDNIESEINSYFDDIENAYVAEGRGGISLKYKYGPTNSDVYSEWMKRECPGECECGGGIGADFHEIAAKVAISLDQHDRWLRTKYGLEIYEYGDTAVIERIVDCGHKDYVLPVFKELKWKMHTNTCPCSLCNLN